MTEFTTREAKILTVFCISYACVMGLILYALTFEPPIPAAVLTTIVMNSSGTITEVYKDKEVFTTMDACLAKLHQVEFMPASNLRVSYCDPQGDPK